MKYSIDYKYVRPKKGKLLKEWHETCFASEGPIKFRQELSSKEYQNAVILPLRRSAGSGLLFGMGGVVDQSGLYIENSGIADRIFGKYEITGECIVHQNVVYCGYLVNQWGHFLIEAVSRLWYCLEYGDDEIDRYVFFIEENETRDLSGNYEEFLTLLGIRDKIEIITKPTRYDKVIIPELSYKRREYYSKQFRNIYLKVVENALKQQRDEESAEAVINKRVYMTRSAIPTAAMSDIGGVMLDNWFSKNGFRIVSPEKMSLSELIRVLNNADVVAAISGTLPHNFLFCQSGTKALIVERFALVNEIQCDINIINSLDVTYIDANLFLYPVGVSIGPFLIYFNTYMAKYAEDNGMAIPDKRFLTDKWKKKIYNNYMDTYLVHYGRGWFFPDWYAEQLSIMHEAYQDTIKELGNYVNGRFGAKIIDRMYEITVKQKCRAAQKKIIGVTKNILMRG